MQHLSNSFRQRGARIDTGTALPSVDADAVTGLLARCPAHAETPLVASGRLAALAGVGQVWIKDERGRMGLGSFKALGAAYVIARDAMARGPADPAQALRGETYVTASAGNHGLSVAAGARVFGARAVILLAETVPESFAERLRAKGAEVRRAGRDYEASVEAARDLAGDQGWQLLSDSSWLGYVDRPWRLMEGYLQLAREAADQMGETPSHVFLQAGVGGLAGAVAAYVRDRWGAAPRVVVVEPEAAPALFESLRAGHAVNAPGPVSIMGRLDCKEPSLIALAGLSGDADDFVTITEAEAEAAMPLLAGLGLATSPSGGAGLAALLAAGPLRETLGLTPQSRVLAILSEGPA